jgi:DNA-binding LacI/PurR family transcriptional regulator
MARSPQHRRSATLATLAAEVGVSRTTVSNAYNRPDQLSPELRKRVLETARRLGYAGPDPVARSLRTRRAGAVGLLLTEELSYAFSDPGAVGFLQGLAGACQRAGQGLHLIPANPEREDVAAVHRAGVDGFIVYSVPADDPHLAAVLQRPLPVVVCDQPRLDGVDHVGIDDRQAMRELAEHVTGLGHRRIGVLCMRLARDRNDGFASAARRRGAQYHVQRARLAGIEDALSAAGLDASSVAVVERFDHTVEQGRSAAGQLLDADSGITALLATSDILALGALAEARERDLRVPEDLSVTGFDGLPEAERADLTTVLQSMPGKGEATGNLLASAVPLEEPRTLCLPTELVTGNTTYRPRGHQQRWFGP